MRQASHAAHVPFSDTKSDAKADLEALFAIRDQDVQRHSNATPQQFAATEPAGLMSVPDTPMPRNGHGGASAQGSFAKTDIFRRTDLQ